MIDHQFRHHRSIVRIQSAESRGTGFWIKGVNDQVYILTCAHVLRDGAPTTVSLFKDDGLFDNENQVAVTIVEQIPVSEGDIALLKVDQDHIPKNAQSLQLLNISFNEPPPFYAFGFPDGFSEHGRPAQGRVIGQAVSNDQLPLLQLKAGIDIRQGFSGGPLIHADLGFVLGLISDRERPEQHALEANYYALSAAFIADKLSIYLKAQSLHPYQAWLASQYHDVVMNDERGMRLSDIYIEPYYAIHESCIEKNNELVDFQIIPKGGFYIVNQTIHNAYAAIIENRLPIVKQKNRITQFILLLGYPGQGKTSFIKRLLNDLISQSSDQSIYLIRLRYITDPKSLLNSPFSVIEKEILRQATIDLGERVPEVELRNALLLLDGLDELCIKNDMTSQDVDDICREIERNASFYPGLRIVLTSRYGYINLEKLFNRDILILQLSEFNYQQQKDWLNRYRSFHPESHLDELKLEFYNEQEKFKSIKELITQPILIHMVASLEIDISDSINRAAIYYKLFDQLVERPWSQHGNIEVLRDISPKLLREALQDMAHAIFHTEKGYLYKSTLKQLPKVQEIQEILENRLEVWRTVMIAFYMGEVKKATRRENESDRDFDYAIEFLHKSLPEYLCAEKIWRAIQEEFLERRPKKTEHAFESLYEIFGEKTISQEISQYLIEIIRNDNNTNKAILFDRLLLLFEEFLLNDFLPGQRIRNPLNSICANFYGFWTVFVQLNNKSNLLEDRILYDRFYRILKLFVYNTMVTPLTLSNLKIVDFFMPASNLQSVDLSRSYLIGANLNYANLNAAKLEMIILKDSQMRGVNLREANLSGADISGVNLSGANLSGANLSEVNLSGANLSEVNLSGANLSGANLSGANLENAYLQGAVLTNANLMDAKLDRIKLANPFIKYMPIFATKEESNEKDLEALQGRIKDFSIAKTTLPGGSMSIMPKVENLLQVISGLSSSIRQNIDLTGANMHGVNLEGVFLSKAALKGALLTNSNLSNANLNGAILTNANLSNATLKDVNLGEAILEGAILISTNLGGGDLTNANMISSNLTEAFLKGAILKSANLGSATLEGANLEGANLEDTILYGAKLINSNLENVILKNANLMGANLKGAKNLTLNQLQSTQSLFKCKEIPANLESQLKQSNPYLFEDPFKNQ